LVVVELAELAVGLELELVAFVHLEVVQIGLHIVLVHIKVVLVRTLAELQQDMHRDKGSQDLVDPM
jgi:hypothetical protein